MRNESDRDRVVRHGRQALKMLNTDQNWTWWLDVGDAILIGREEAMHEAGTNRPEGGAYNRLFGEWLTREKLDFDKGDRSRLLQVMDNRLAIEGWRATLTLVERRRLNHPSTVLRKWKAATAVHELKEPKPTLRDSVVNLSDDNAAKDREIADLKALVAELEAARETTDSAETTPRAAFALLNQMALQREIEPQTLHDDPEEMMHLVLEIERVVKVWRKQRQTAAKAAAKAKAKTAAKPALVWEVTAAEAKQKYPHYTAKLATGHYAVSPAIEVFSGTQSYSVTFLPVDFDWQKNNNKVEIAQGIKTAEAAKAIAEEHYAAAK